MHSSSTSRPSPRRAPAPGSPSIWAARPKASRVTGSASADTITGGAGVDTIDGGAGNDTINGFVGADTVDGGANTDTIVLTATSADLNSASDAQILNVEAISAAGAGAGVTINLGSQTEGFTITGSTSGDTITGGAGADTIDGGAGNDIIDGGAGNDTIVGGVGADTLTGGANTDTLNYAASAAGVTVNLATNTASGGDAAGDIISGFENITGSGLDDVLTGDTGVNVIDGGAGNDTIAGGAGADTLTGGANTDTLDYSASSAGVTINLTANTAAGGDAASDTISGFENVIGSAFVDTLTAAAAGSTLTGLAGNDTLTGAAGNDTLIGGAGTDALSGAGGNDTYTFALTDGTDTITEGGGTDDIDIDAQGAALTTLDFSDSNTTNATGNLVIAYNGQQITVTNHFVAGNNTVETLTFLGGATYMGHALGTGAYTLSTDDATPRAASVGVDTILAGSTRPRR